MSKSNFLLLLIFISIFSCNKKDSEYPLEKRYWTVNDYQNVIRHIKYGLKPNQIPTFNNPENKIVVEKLVDQNNYAVILDDKELGINYKHEIAEEYFRVWQDLLTIYDDFDKQDKYQFEEEYLKAWHFGLNLQIKYFSLGNESIKKGSDESDSFYTNSTIKSNHKTLIENFNIYLDKLNNEDSFSTKGIILFNYGIKKHVRNIIESIPVADFGSMTYKIDSLLKKTKNESTKKELASILNLIKSKKTENIKKKA